MSYTISRLLEIDAGHRVHTHGSKCANFHGHRYSIIATCGSDILHEKGEQSGMTLDFGFLKGLMVEKIDKPCDHGMIMDMQDPMAPLWRQNFGKDMKTHWVHFIPTAENLARYWFYCLEEGVRELSKHLAWLDSVEVFETPNCSAVFRPTIVMAPLTNTVVYSAGEEEGKKSA